MKIAVDKGCSNGNQEVVSCLPAGLLELLLGQSLQYPAIPCNTLLHTHIHHLNVTHFKPSHHSKPYSTAPPGPGARGDDGGR